MIGAITKSDLRIGGPMRQLQSADKSDALQTLREFLTAISNREASGVRALERRFPIISELTSGNSNRRPLKRLKLSQSLTVINSAKGRLGQAEA